MFSGAITAMVTPFRDGRVDEERLREQIAKIRERISRKRRK